MGDQEFDGLINRTSQVNGLCLAARGKAFDMAMLRLLAREDAGLAVIPSIVVQDELANGTLVLAARIDEMRETFYAITRERRFPNPVLAQLFAARSQPSA